MTERDRGVKLPVVVFFFFFGVGKRISSGDIDRLCTSSIYSNSLNDFLITQFFSCFSLC